MLVKQIVELSSLPLPSNCSSWLNYWEKQYGAFARYCAAERCSQPPETIAYVRKEEAFNCWDPCYIVPLCSECDMQSKKAFIACQRNLAVITSL